MQFRILGTLEVESGGGLIPLGSPRQRQLLALLLVHGGQAVSTDRLAEELWSGSPPETARHTLQAYIARMRKAFGLEHGRLEGAASGYRLSVSAAELDALRFEWLAEDGRRALSADDPERATELLAEALGLWRGPVLSDLADLDAFHLARARLDGARVAVLEDRVDADLALGRHSELVAELDTLVSEHPLRERLWAQLMLALYRSGRQAEALEAFQRARKLLNEELGIDPGPWLTEVQSQILLQDPAIAGPRAQRPRPAANNLPVSRTSFIGRRREMEELEGLLRIRRLVTITGPPGSGKTRLALELARRTLGNHPHGTFFVPLAEIEDPHLVASAIDAVLSIPASERPLTEALVAYIRPRRLLLVLDNVEHVLPGAELVGRLLDAAAGLTVLATSRAPLRLSGEQEYPLEPLPLPMGEDVLLDPSKADALALFADRARAVDPAFELNRRNASLVVEIVARLDRLPLAIELAAPQLRSLSLEGLRRRFGPVLPHLTDGPIDSPLRQRTLRDAIAWSYELLARPEQAAFQRLSVFRGSFSLDAARSVASGDPVRDLGAAVSRLVDASLIQRPVEPGPARFSMLETIREYGLERLEEVGEATETGHSHAEFYANLIEGAEPQLTGPHLVEWLELLTVEQPNLRAALVWAKRHGNIERALFMAGRMWRFWQLRGNLSEGRHVLEDLIRSADDEPSLPRIKALIGLALLCYWMADLDAAEANYRQAREMLHIVEDPLLRAEALFGEIGTLACHRGLIEPALVLHREFQALAAHHEHPVMVLMNHVLSGMLLRFSGGDLEDARAHGLEALAMTREAGDRWWEGDVLRALGQISYEQGRFDQAEATLHESLEIAWEIGFQVGVAIDLNWLGLVAVTRGRPEHGVVLAAAASRLRETVGGGFTVQHYRQDAEQPQDAARRYLADGAYEVAWARGRTMSIDDAVGFARSTANIGP